ncbi:MAG: hypothetical protein QOI09_573 [Chloroflexota bacterium]|nr:hypothetical protein [Chloroflexota bacterium]
MRRSIGFLISAMLAVSLLSVGWLAGASSTDAATVAATTTCSNGVDNTGGLGLICQVTIANTFTGTGGSSRVTVRECHGAAGDPTAACTTTVKNLSRPVTAVNQCNDSINGGGGTLRCRVRVVNTFIGVSPGSMAATVNQCVGSGGGITIGCDPFPATTTGATINQCNGSANGGGALVICSASIVNRIGSTGGTTSPGGTLRPPETSTTVEPAAQPAGFGPLVLAGLIFVVALAGMALAQRTARRSTRR